MASVEVGEKGAQNGRASGEAQGGAHLASSCCTCAASVVTRACAFFMFSMRLPMPPPSLPNRLCTRSDAVLLQAFVDRGQWVPVLLARAVVAGPSEPDHEESRLHISSTAKMRWRALHMGRQGWVRPRRFRAGHNPRHSPSKCKSSSKHAIPCYKPFRKGLVKSGLPRRPQAVTERTGVLRT